MEADGFVAFREAVWRTLIREIAAPSGPCRPRRAAELDRLLGPVRRVEDRLKMTVQAP